MDILKELNSLKDADYAAFQAKLTPTVDPDTIMGVRVPLLRKLAKDMVKAGEAEKFLTSLPHTYYEENMLHGLILALEKDYTKCIKGYETFFPYIDNWAVCDSPSPKVFVKHKKELIDKIRQWSCSSHTYTCRFAIEMLMAYYLDEDFQEEYLEIPAAVTHSDYYVKMMVAWFYATALAKQWTCTVKYLEDKKLDPWIHNKTIQKARESYRISDEQKEYLKSLKAYNMEK